ncbi:MAG: divalent-cation tolerance protein CutA [Candidatus Aenigmarchaeota archaeon]|nr:divalent-cation tolerance protein CutA [Candidatus Aenigmarchaeota archaeon]
MPFVSVYITCKNVKEAKRLAEVLVKERLVACANIIPKMESLYRWKGKIQNESEAALIGKTISENAKKIIKRVKELHSYDTPCVVFWPIIDGNKDYLEWIRKETK